jgi:hypothetical protein
MADNSMTGTFQLNLPKDLLLEAKRTPRPSLSNCESRLAQFLAWRVSELLVASD